CASCSSDAGDVARQTQSGDWARLAPNRAKLNQRRDSRLGQKAGNRGLPERRKALTCARALGVNGPLLDVAVEHELPRVRPKRDRVDFLLALVFDPGLDH